jgi:hypothetical protein
LSRVVPTSTTSSFAEELEKNLFVPARIFLLESAKALTQEQA